ncbi:ATP-dependent Clp protease ATP-binding subunit [candidate division WOR-3 bacterium]|nr:ATP-dependent Clp protease ATP-binding subunit [candidate division WOR-3 bacterium]
MNSENFTLRYRKIIMSAQKNSRLHKRGYYTTLDILYAILTETNCFAVKIFQKLGVDISLMKKIIAAKIFKNDYYKETPRYPPNFKDPVPTIEVESVIQGSMKKAEELSHMFIGTEHLILSVLDNIHSAAGEIMKSLDITYVQFNAGLQNLIEESDFAVKEDDKRKIGRPRENIDDEEEDKFALEDFCRDLSGLAEEGKLDPIIGRDKEIERVVQVLSRRRKNNPVLIGEAGVGKTAIVEGLAQKVVQGQAPPSLIGKKFYQLNLASVVAGTKYRGQFESRMKSIIETIKNRDDIVLFIDELHTIVGAGSAEGSLDASHILKPSLARGEIKCIGATTVAEYHRHVEKDGSLKRRFQPILVESPGISEAINILKGLKEKYEDHHGIHYEESALKAAVILADRYITDRQLPDKAIDVIDETGARVKLSAIPPYPHLEEDEVRLKKILESKIKAVSEQQYENAAELRDREAKIRAEIDKKQKEWLKMSDKVTPVVTEEDIREVVSMWTNVPIQRLQEKEQDKLINLEGMLGAKVISQAEAIKAVSRAIRRGRMGLKDPKRPLGSFLFLGPTGVGKTELAKSLAEILFGSKSNLIRLDMSEYMEKYSVSRLIGSPPGYIGYGEQNPVIEEIRVKPYSVVLFDEIEKAHIDVLNILLQLLEEGEITDSLGRKISFRHCVIIMTSNIGTKDITRSKPLGFGSTPENIDYGKMKDNILSELKRMINPEIINRIDEVVVFRRLTREDMKKIVDLVFEEVRDRIKEKEIEIELSEGAKELLVEEGYDPSYGARPLRRVFRRYVEDPLVEEFLQGSVKINDSVLIERSGQELRFVVKNVKDPKDMLNIPDQKDGDFFSETGDVPADG